MYARRQDDGIQNSYLLLLIVMNTTSPAVNPTAADPANIWGLSFQAGMGILFLMLICVVAFYLLSRLRGLTSKDGRTVEMLQKNFEEMRFEGDLSEAEFRKIRESLKSVAAARPSKEDHSTS